LDFTSIEATKTCIKFPTVFRGHVLNRNVLKGGLISFLKLVLPVNGRIFHIMSKFCHFPSGFFHVLCSSIFGVDFSMFYILPFSE